MKAKRRWGRAMRRPSVRALCTLLMAIAVTTPLMLTAATPSLQLALLLSGTGWVLADMLVGTSSARGVIRPFPLSVLRTAGVALLVIGAVSLVGQASPQPEVVLQLGLLAVGQFLLAAVLTVSANALDPVKRLVITSEEEAATFRVRRSGGRVRGLSPAILNDPIAASRIIRAELDRMPGHAVHLHPGVPEEVVRQVSWDLRHSDTQVVLVPQLASVRPSRTHVAIDREEQPALVLAPPRPSLPARFVKRATDIVGGSLILLVLSPIMLGTAFLIRREDGGPALFTQQRVGLNGELFTIHKFRTMRVDADAQLEKLLKEQGTDGKPLFKVQNDPRLTKHGSFLRRSSIDELPQLLDVIRGEMSLVGPRPQRPKEVALYSGADHHRLGVRPGMTGLWQVSGRSRLTWEQARELDVHYAHNWTPLLDAQILLRTLTAVIKGDGAY